MALKARLVLTVVLVAVFAGAAHAQDVTGTWQGTMQTARPLRIVFRIAPADAGLTAVMISVDQSPQPIAGSIAQQGTALKISFPGIGATYEGRLTVDAGAIVGTFAQGGMQIPLNLSRATSDTAWALPAPPAPAVAMAADAVPEFEVAAIRPSNPDAQGKLFTVRGRQILTINTTVLDVLAFAYALHPGQIVGGPDWLATEKYDITGQPNVEGIPNQAQLRVMFQKLLADRFQLVFHRDRSELSVYALVVVPSGPKLTRSAGDPNGLPSMLFPRFGTLPVQNATMGDFANVMQTVVLDRPVVDRTGLLGRWDFTLMWTPDESQFSSMGVRLPPPSTDPAAPPGLFTAIQEQIGLRFEPARASAEVIVIDRVERPSAN